MCFFSPPPLNLTGLPEGGDLLRAGPHPLSQAQGGERETLIWVFFALKLKIPRFHALTISSTKAKRAHASHRSIQAEARAEFAERSVQKLQKEVDRLEGKDRNEILYQKKCAIAIGKCRK